MASLADSTAQFEQLLTWAAMTTLFSREEGTLLGHHIEPQTKSSTTYNRDSQILLQRNVSQLISSIKSGKLQPDASRAQRLSMLLGDEALDSGHNAQEPGGFYNKLGAE